MTTDVAQARSRQLAESRADRSVSVLFLGPEGRYIPCRGCKAPETAGKPSKARRVDIRRSGQCCVTPPGFDPCLHLNRGLTAPASAVSTLRA
jgi:hypothetical protein